MTIFKTREGFFDPIVVPIILVCFIIGGLYMFKSKQVDAPIEQAAEAVLHMEGIDVDFSAEKKQELEQSNTQVPR